MGCLRLLVISVLCCSACSGDDFTSSSGGGGGGQGNTGAVTNGGSGGALGGGTGGIAGGPGGAAGIPGNGGAPAGGGSAGAPSGGSGGSAGGVTSCAFASGNCPPGQYCDAPDCITGTCKPKVELQEPSLNAVCGCDSITYWNASVAASHGMAVKSASVCKAIDGKKCSNGACPGGAHCDRHAINILACGNTDFSAALCWMVPENCGAAYTPGAHSCDFGCMSLCAAIADDEQYYSDPVCN